MRETTLINVMPSRANVLYRTIYGFTNAEAFNFNRPTGQRDLVEATIKSVTKAIEEGKSHLIPCVQVDANTMTLYDGQNRVEAFMRAWAKGIQAELRVNFTDGGSENMIEMQNSQKWQTRDYIKYLVENGNETVKRVLDFGLNHKLTKRGSGVKISYLGVILTGRRIEKELKQDPCTLVLTDEDFDRAEKLYKEIEMMYDVIDEKGNNWLDTFITSWYWFRNSKDEKVRLSSNKIDLIGMKKLCKIGEDDLKHAELRASREYWDGFFKDLIDRVYSVVTAPVKE